MSVTFADQDRANPRSKRANPWQNLSLLNLSLLPSSELEDAGPANLAEVCLYFLLFRHSAWASSDMQMTFGWHCVYTVLDCCLWRSAHILHVSGDCGVLRRANGCVCVWGGGRPVRGGEESWDAKHRIKRGEAAEAIPWRCPAQ
jgi:hypothetical protein